MSAEPLFDPGPAQERPRPPLYTDGGIRSNHATNLRVRALYHSHVLGWDVPEGHTPTPEEARRTRAVRGRFNADMARITERLALPQFGKLRPHAHSTTSPRTAHERAIDATRTPMRKFFAGQDMPDWVLTNVAATICYLHGWQLPGDAYVVQQDLGKLAELRTKMRVRRAARAARDGHR